MVLARVTREMRGPSGLGQQKLFNSEGQSVVQLNSVWLGSAVFVLTLGSLLTVVGCMMPHPQQQSGDNFNYRIPPRWNPEQDQQYSFRAYTTDLMLWTLLTDLQPHQQAAAVVMRLGGSAREAARTLSAAELMHGGEIGGIHYDPVTYILAGLQMRFGQLDDETRLASMNEFLAFARRPGENTN